MPPPTDANGVLAGLDGRIAAVLDAGETTHKIPSTVVDLTSNPARVLRRGALSIHDLAALIAIEGVPSRGNDT